MMDIEDVPYVHESRPTAKPNEHYALLNGPELSSDGPYRATDSDYEPCYRLDRTYYSVDAATMGAIREDMQRRKIRLFSFLNSLVSTDHPDLKRSWDAGADQKTPPHSCR